MTQLQTIPDAASPEVVANEVNETLSAAALYGKMHDATSGLTWGYYGGLYNGNSIADGTVTLTNTSDNYVVVLRSTGVVSTSTSSTNSVNPLYAKLYKLTCAGGVVTVETDQRQDANGFMRGEPSTTSRSPSVQSVTSSATVTPTFSDDIVKITAQAAGLTLANPTGTAIEGLGIVIRIKDNGTARSVSYGTQYRAIGVTLPTTTVLSKTLYLGMVFNNTDTKWDVLAVGQEA